MSAIFDAGYNPNVCWPKLEILTPQEVMQYQFTSEELDPGATRDFILDPLWNTHKGVNGDPSTMEFFIVDEGKALVETDSKKGSKIKRGWIVKFYLGQTTANLERVFYGWVQTADVIRDTNQYALHRVFCAHWTHRFEKRTSKIKTFQKKEADGITPDDTDNEAKTSEIFKRFCVRKEYSVIPSIQGEPQTDVPGLRAYYTFEESLQDKSSGSNHHITPNPAFRDDTTNESDVLPGFTATFAVLTVGTLHSTKYTGIRPNDEISDVRMNIEVSAGNIRVKVYDDDGAGDPNNLLAESGSVASPGTGEQNIALTTRAVTPADGIIHVAVETDNATFALKQTTGLTSGTTKTVLHTFGTGADPFGTVTNQTYGWELGYHLIPQIINELDYVNAAVGKGCQGDGVVIYEIPDFDEFNGDATTFSASIAHKLAAAPVSQEDFYAHWDTNAQRAWRMYVDTNGYFNVQLTDDGITVDKHYEYQTNVCDDTIKYLGFTWNNGTLLLYVNGVEVTTVKTVDTAMTAIHNSTAKVTIFGSLATAVPALQSNALLDEARIYEDNKNADQMDSIHHPPFDTQDVQDIDIKLEGFVSAHNSLSDLANQITAATEALYGMDDNRRVFLRTPNQINSGWLFTNQLSGNTVVSHDQTTLGIIASEGFILSDTIRESGKSLVTGVGSQESTLDINQNTEDSLHDLSQAWAAIPWTPSQNNLNKVSFKLKRFGKPEHDLIVLISTNAAGTGKIARIAVSKENLRAISDIATTWIEVGFKKRLVDIDDEYFVRIEKAGTEADHYELAYDFSAGGSFEAETGTKTGTPTLRTYPTSSLDLIMYNAAAARKFGINETTLNLRGLPSLDTAAEILFGIAPVLGGERRTYPPIKYRAQPKPPKLGTFCIINDSYLILSRKAMIIGWDAVGSTELSGGCDTMTVHVEEYSL